MTDLLSELEAVVLGIEMATPGKFPLGYDAAKDAAQFLRTHHAEIAAAVRDAARYRWLRDHNNVIGEDGLTECPVEIFINGESHAPGHLDAQVDTAMRAGEGEG